MATGYGAKFQTQVTALAWAQIQAEPFGRGSFVYSKHLQHILWSTVYETSFVVPKFNDQSDLECFFGLKESCFR
jgi:hypothetical protein